MQPSSCLWKEKETERYYLQDCAEIRGGNWVETLAMNKSKQYITMGACFPASILFPHLLLFFFSKRDYLTVVFWPLCFNFYVLGGWDIRAHVCFRFTLKLRYQNKKNIYMWVCVSLGACWECQLLWCVYPKRKTVSAILWIFHTIISLSNICAFCTFLHLCRFV